MGASATTAIGIPGDQVLREYFDNHRRPTWIPTKPTGRVTMTTMLTVIALIAGPIAEVEAKDAREIVAAECVACHGMDGNGPVPTFPKLAGIQQEYLAKQLLELANGTRRSDVMKPIAEKYSQAELFALATYFSGQLRTPGVVTNPSLVDAGRVLYHQGNKVNGVPACAGCHKPDGTGTPRSPMLAGQDAAYTLLQLRNFDHDIRTNDRGRLMRTVAGRMNEEEMRAVSEYIAGMAVMPGRP
ncbi:MAG: cytochrome c4 [Gammaproteobacteria bacterium]|nr:cytochrome c4 [Gammaproteobacteria bacterium]